MFSPGIEPGTFCVLDRCDNRYTTKTLGSEKHVRSMYFRVFWGGADFCPLNTLCGHPQLNCRDRLVVRTLRCGRSNPGSNPGLGSCDLFFFFFFKKQKFVCTEPQQEAPRSNSQKNFCFNSKRNSTLHCICTMNWALAKGGY